MKQLELFCVSFLLGLGQAGQLSLKETVVFGPGIDAKRSSLPINYFYIQGRDKNGNNVTEIDDSSLEVSFEPRLRVRSEKMDLGGGLLLFQYRVFSNYQSVTVHIKYNGKHLGDSPYHIGHMLHENCACPLRTPQQWMEDFKCPQVETQILHDLKTFKNGVNVTDLYDRATQQFSRHSFVHYSVVDRKLYARTFGDIVGFKFLSDMILLSITNKVALPDMELIVNLGDWPLSKVKKRDGVIVDPFPMFSWCGSGDTWDIVWPTWDLMKSTIMGMDRVTLSILTALRTLGHPPWQERQPRVFFRGRDSNQVRLDLVQKHHKNTELFDVGITAWFFFTYDEDLYGPKAERVGFNDFFNYKYQINIDGTVAAYRLPYLFAGGSLVFKQDSPYYEHFYHQLEPWVHYIPLKRDISDLLERVEWARENDQQAKEIAENSARFVQQNLLPEHQYCYMVRLLQEYGKLIVDNPKIHPGMEAVVPEVPHDCTEDCKQLNTRTEMNKNRLKEEL